MSDTDSAPESREPVRFLVFSASLRADSLNGRLAALAATVIEANGGMVERTSMADFETPSYSADVQDGEGFPPGAERFRALHRGLRRLRDQLARVQRLDAR